MRRLSVLDAIARKELGGRKPQVGDTAPCPSCGQVLHLVQGIDLEHLLQTGDIVKGGLAWIHAGPDEAARCRRVRGH